MTIRSAGDGFELLDAGSRNGTFINGERLQGAAPLVDADRITIGRDDASVRRMTFTRQTRECRQLASCLLAACQLTSTTRLPTACFPLAT